MSHRLLTAWAGLLALAGAAPAGAVTITDGGSILNDFVIRDTWRANQSGIRNIASMTFVPEAGGSALYASLRGKGMTRLTVAAPASPKTAETLYSFNYIAAGDNTDGVRAGNPLGMATWLDYNGSGDDLMLWTSGYAPGGRGVLAGADNSYATADTGDEPVVTAEPGASDQRYHNEGTFVPGDYTWNGADAYFVVSRSKKTIRQFELNGGRTGLVEGTLPGRANAEFERSKVYDLLNELGNGDILSAEFADYTAGGGKAALYLTVGQGVGNVVNQAYGMIAVTPGLDGRFGADGSGVNDDEAVGYYFGEGGVANANGNYNTMAIQKQHIASYGSGSATVDIDGSYSTGFGAAAFDPASGLLYLHGTGDYGLGIVLEDMAAGRAQMLGSPEPATLALLAVGGLVAGGAGLRRRRAHASPRPA